MFETILSLRPVWAVCVSSVAAFLILSLGGEDKTESSGGDYAVRDPYQSGSDFFHDSCRQGGERIFPLLCLNWRTESALLSKRTVWEWSLPVYRHFCGFRLLCIPSGI